MPGDFPVKNFQFVQREIDLIEARLVASRKLTPDEEVLLRRQLLTRLPDVFRFTFSYCDEIPRGAGGKFEDFISELD